MADDIDKAANAFDAAMNVGSTGGGNGEKTTIDQSAVFKHLGVPEVDDESPERGGGDDEPDPEAVLYAKQDAGKDNRGKPNKEPAGEDGAEDEQPDDEEGDGEDTEGDEEDEEAEGVDAGELDLSTKVKVMVDGEEATVPLKEALEGYIRTETFHRRLSEMSESQKIVRNAAAEVVKNYDYARQLITTMEAQLKELVPPEPNWDEEFKKDPARARGLQKYYEQVKGFTDKLKQQRDEVNKQQSAHDAEQLKVYAETEELRFNRLNSKNWGTDPTRKGKDLQAMRRTALSEGFSEEELNGVFDSRMLQVLLKASKYDRMVAARPKPKASAAKSVQPGPGKRSTNGTGRKGFSDAMKTLAKSGTVESAAPVFDAIMRRNTR